MSPSVRRGAPVTIIEYASVMCPICKAFHDAMWTQLKHNYIDTGKVRFIMREFPTGDLPPADVVAAFQVVRCGNATPDQYFARADVFYDQQGELLRHARRQRTSAPEAGRYRQVRESERAAGDGLHQRSRRRPAHGSLVQERRRPRRHRHADAFLNGTKMDPTPGTYAELARKIDAAIAGH